ncbi:rhomboid-like protein [Streptomyces sp. CT34]|uniref:rhomboid-like protein n=1 Tax=Streptomyces sp. CT34 TaxID=1553907 RepID=UPI000AEC43C8|nr:rhomboid-like protein [Streptomyces sp. CT34]
MRTRGRAVRYGALPWAAPLYVGVVQLGAYATGRLPGRRRAELLRAHSTNVANLRGGRWGTLATSAAFVEKPLPVAYGAALLATLGTAEARWGAGRAAGVFAAGHIGAGLLVYAGLRARPGGCPDGTARAVDVGASYGFCATLGALAATVPHRGVRRAAVGGLLVSLAVPVVRRGRTFTDAGHLAALALGVVMGATGATGAGFGRRVRRRGAGLTVNSGAGKGSRRRDLAGPAGGAAGVRQDRVTAEVV